MWRTGDRRRVPVERDVTDHNLAPGFGAHVGERRLDTEPGQPVGEVAHRFVVAEVGLPHPTLGFVPVYDEGLAVALDGEAAFVNGARSQHDAGRLVGRS